MSKETLFAVIGLGTFGRQVCEVLMEKGGRVLAVDTRADIIDRMKDSVTQAVLLDATDENALSTLPFDEVDIAIVAMGENREASILATAILKRMGVPYILSRSSSDLHTQVLKQVGADEVLNIEISEGSRIARRLMAPEILDRIPISETITVAELYVSKNLVGKELSKLNLRKKYNINIIAVKRSFISIDELGNPVKSEELIFPDSDTKLKEHDIILIVGKNEDIDSFKDF